MSGEITPKAKGELEYSSAFIDDFSGFVFYYFLKHKSDATQATEKFIADIAHVRNMRKMTTDGEDKYMGHEFKNLLSRNKIKHKVSSPHTPSQNGTAERNWRTGFDMARCLLLDSNLPKCLWNYALANKWFHKK